MNKNFKYIIIGIVITMGISTYAYMSNKIRAENNDYETDISDIYTFNEYLAISKELKYHGQLDYNIRTSDFSLFPKLLNNFSEDNETTNFSISQLTPNKSEASPQRIPGNDFYISILKNISKLRIHEILLSPYADTGNISQIFSDIFGLLTSNPPILKNGFVMPPTQITESGNLKQNRAGKETSLFQLRPQVPVDIGDKLCTNDYLCINMDVYSKKRDSNPEPNVNIDKLKIIESIEETNTWLNKLTTQSLSMKCVNKQTFGNRYYQKPSFFKSANVHINIAGKEEPKEITEDKLQTDIDDLSESILNERLFDEIKNSSIDGNVDQDELAYQTQKTIETEQTKKDLEAIRKEFSSYDTLNTVFEQPVNTLTQIEKTITNFASELIKFSLDLYKKPQAK